MTPPPRQTLIRFGVGTLLVSLAVIWYSLSSSHNSFATPVLLLAFALSVVCAYLNLKGKL